MFDKIKRYRKNYELWSGLFLNKLTHMNHDYSYDEQIC